MTNISTHKLDVIDKISAIIDYPAKGLILKHQVSLSTKDTYPTKLNKRKYYLEEWLYYTEKYLDYNELISLKLNFSYSLLLESIDKNKDVSLFINNRGIAMILRTLKEIIDLFTDVDKDLYLKDSNDRLILNADYNGLKFKTVISNKILLFKPTIIYKDEEQYEGLDLYISKKENRFEITVEQLFNLYHILDKLDLYSASLQLLNYVGRPQNNFYLQKVNVSYKNQELEDKAVSHNMSKVRKMGETDKKEENIFTNFKDIPLKIRF